MIVYILKLKLLSSNALDYIKIYLALRTYSKRGIKSLRMDIFAFKGDESFG